MDNCYRGGFQKTALVRVLKQTRAQDEEKLPDVWLCFAPIKRQAGLVD